MGTLMAQRKLNPTANALPTGTAAPADRFASVSRERDHGRRFLEALA